MLSLDSPPQVEKFVEALTAWYAAHARDLPWRHTREPYAILVSEIMLQQTRVEAVIPYYHRFLEAFPDFRALAAADEDALLKCWQGLGYYSRARNLRKLARIVTERHSGALPDDEASLRALPGIGAYTLGAVCSIAFGRPHPAVDGNVMRVMARVLALEEDIARSAARAAVRSWLTPAVEASDPATFNQALMELGALVCLPKEPRCPDCPLHKMCNGFAQGCPTDFPVKSPAPKKRLERRNVILLRCGDAVLMRKRPETGLLAGMWEFPSAPADLPLESLPFLEGMRIVERRDGPSAAHAFSHVKWEMRGIALTCAARRPVRPPCAWVERAQIGALATPSAMRVFVRYMRGPATPETSPETLPGKHGSKKDAD